MQLTPELTAIIVPAMVLIGQLLRQGRRTKAIERRVRDVQAAMRSLPCISIATRPPEPHREADSPLLRPPTGEYACPVDS